MDGYHPETAHDRQYSIIWEKALEEYSKATGNDLQRFQHVRSTEELSRIEDDFKLARRGSKELENTRKVLKACVGPLEELGGVGSGALGLTPFAPAATILGAGMYLLGKRLSIHSKYVALNEFRRVQNCLRSFRFRFHTTRRVQDLY